MSEECNSLWGVKKLLKGCLNEAKQKGLSFHIASHSYHDNDMHLHFTESSVVNFDYEMDE